MSRLSEQIIKLRNEGKTFKQIKNELNCALSTISYHCKLNKLPTPIRKLTDEDKINLQKLYDEIRSVNKIAIITGYAKETVLKYVNTKKKEKIITPSQSVISWRKRKKRELIEYKGNKCLICGYSKCDSALHFHHLNPNEKDFAISGKSLSFDRLKSEVDKCILVCSNCHSEIHDGLINPNDYLNSK